jgi:hypothetical protein
MNRRIAGESCLKCEIPSKSRLPDPPDKPIDSPNAPADVIIEASDTPTGFENRPETPQV